jgi:photosystem II stability/assembly factor-like uncharacterized protein
MPQSSGTTRFLTAVSMLDADKGVAVGGGGTILRTSDGGCTWLPHLSGTTNSLSAVYFVDANFGWAVGEAGTILHTIDGGENWTPQSSPETRAWLWGVSFADAKTGTAVGDEVILHTTDGGTTWRYQSGAGHNSLFAVSVLDANRAVAVGYDYLIEHLGHILRTTDGGDTWTVQYVSVQPLSGISFGASNAGTAVGNLGVVVRTTDGGNSWHVQPTASSASFRGVFAVDANVATAVGDNGAIMRTTTGGELVEHQLGSTGFRIGSPRLSVSVDR